MYKYTNGYFALLTNSATDVLLLIFTFITANRLHCIHSMDTTSTDKENSFNFCFMSYFVIF